MEYTAVSIKMAKIDHFQTQEGLIIFGPGPEKERKAV
jgi:hypothetical protein